MAMVVLLAIDLYGWLMTTKEDTNTANLDIVDHDGLNPQMVLAIVLYVWLWRTNNHQKNTNTEAPVLNGHYGLNL